MGLWIVGWGAVPFFGGFWGVKWEVMAVWVPGNTGLDSDGGAWHPFQGVLGGS